MLKVGIYGASGYTGQELLRLLLRHPQTEIVALTSRRYAGVSVSDIYPVFIGLTDLAFIDASPDDVAGLADIVFLALPHGVSMKVAPVFLKAGKKVIDLSADFRLRDVAAYEQWYGRHTAPDVIKESVYGIPELYRDDIVTARLVANPGCYPTSAILPLAPLLKDGLISNKGIAVNSLSGVSGAGRSASSELSFVEVNESVKAYKVGAHQHTPEIKTTLEAIAGSSVSITFVPHLIPITRGIYSSIYAEIRNNITAEDVIRSYQKYYSSAPFVRVSESAIPEIKNVLYSNYIDIGFRLYPDNNHIIIFSVIDNLVKGAAGQAVQNMNILFDYDETEGLL